MPAVPSSSEDAPPLLATTAEASTTSGSAAAAALEPLSCQTCRARKLKCDRAKPVCFRCARVSTECVYPESRRKPAFKRRNVKELEERLAQVEGLLKHVGKDPTAKSSTASSSVPEETSPAVPEGPNVEFDPDTFFSVVPPITSPPEPSWQSPSVAESPEDGDDDNNNNRSGQFIRLGQFESLPPTEMIEDLHNVFFQTQQHFIPIVHKATYMRSFYSAPHMRPPMCLQYAIWTMAANGHPKYGQYHDVFYQRTRQYLEADELKGFGEHFITVAHAQAWALTATNEARCMYFTRAAMSSARCARLVHMMGLHRLDDPCEADNPIAPTLAPPKSWTELEERRRVFWGVFCINAHASISTGWPILINIDEVTTRLPSTEEAFNFGREEPSATLQDVFNGANYSTFAGSAVICHIFSQLLRHVHRRMPTDKPDDVDNGMYWKRHRTLDTELSSAFMFLPERLRLPRNVRDPVAVQTNLNLHASVICLHNSACEKVDKYKLSAQLRQASRARALTAAQEIVNIMKMTSHMTAGYKSPLVALSLYCAAAVYIFQAKDNASGSGSNSQPACDINENLEFLVRAMESIGRHHVITRAYLTQVLLDIERHGISANINLPHAKKDTSLWPNHNIPVVARNSISAHTKMQSPLPGRLPLASNRVRLQEGPFSAESLYCRPFSAIPVDAPTADIGAGHHPLESFLLGRSGTTEVRSTKESTSSGKMAGNKRRRTQWSSGAGNDPNTSGLFAFPDWMMSSNNNNSTPNPSAGTPGAGPIGTATSPGIGKEDNNTTFRSLSCQGTWAGLSHNDSDSGSPSMSSTANQQSRRVKLAHRSASTSVSAATSSSIPSFATMDGQPMPPTTTQANRMSYYNTLTSRNLPSFSSPPGQNDDDFTPDNLRTITATMSAEVMTSTTTMSSSSSTRRATVSFDHQQQPSRQQQQQEQRPRDLVFAGTDDPWDISDLAGMAGAAGFAASAGPLYSHMTDFFSGADGVNIDIGNNNDVACGGGGGEAAGGGGGDDLTFDDDEIIYWPSGMGTIDDIGGGG